MADLGLTADLGELAALAAGLEDSSRRVVEGASLVARKYGTDVTARAQQAVPVRTGNLRASITPTTQVSRGAIETTVGPTADYGGFVELGTRRQRPQPYLGPAHDAVVEQAIEALGTIGEDAL